MMRRSTGACLALLALLGACGGAPTPPANPSPAQPDNPAGAGYGAASANATALAASAERYTCPMHPHFLSTDADGRCPICGMALVPRTVTDAGDSTAPRVSVAPEIIQTLGVRSTTAAVVDLGRTLRAFGTVAPNQRLQSVASSRAEGWVKDLRITAEGDAVSAGTLLYRLYSPELLAAQKDYLSALADTSGPATRRAAAALQRLRSLGLQESAALALQQQRSLQEEVPVYAEHDGTVVELMLREGDYLKPGSPTLRVQSYASVWVVAQVPEQDLALVEVGQQARLRFPGQAGADRTGRISFIDPRISRGTRTGAVRIELDNRDGRLRAGAYVDVSLELGTRPGLAIASEAILHSSAGAHVILDLGAGQFASRPVELGLHSNGRTEILAGLKPGDRVVASGQFLLDSELNLREGFAKLVAPAPMEPGTALAALPMDARTLAEIDHFTDAALYLHQALTTGGPVNPAYLEPALKLGQRLQDRFADTELATVLWQGEQALRRAQAASAETGPARSQDLAAALAELVNALEPWVTAGAPDHYRRAGLRLHRDQTTGQRWLQQGEPPVSPYRRGGNAGATPSASKVSAGASSRE